MTCFVCSSSSWKHKFNKQGYDFLQCEGCGLLKLDPVPSVETLTEFYLARAASGNYEPQKAVERTPGLLRLFSRIEERRKGSRIFDIGCFDGAFLDIAKSKGWETAGLELQGHAAEKAAASHRVSMATVEGFDPSSVGTFDVVTAIDLIEHLRDPVALMKVAKRLLAPGGLLVLQTPNWGSWMAKGMQKYWMPIAAPEHIHYFTHQNLARFCNDHGIQTVACENHWKQLRLGYALDQFENFGVELNRVVKVAKRAIPSGLLNMQMLLFGGEMLLFAEAPR